MNITHIESMEWDLIRITTSRLWIANLTILFGFSELRNNRYS